MKATPDRSDLLVAYRSVTGTFRPQRRLLL